MRDKRDKFVGLAEARVTRTIKDIRLIGNLSNKNSYTYASKDIKLIFRTLQKEIDAAKARFGGDDTAGGDAFKLEE